MLMKKYFIIAFLLCLLLLQVSTSVYAQLGLPLAKNYSPEEYKGGIQNWQILQDERGVIYVANNFGLLQYDGNDWRTYPISAASKLRSIALGTNGRIYAGCQGDFGYFDADSLGSLRYHSLKYLIPEKYKNIEETWKVYVINNKVYFCTFTNLYVYENDTITVITHNTGLDISYSSNSTLYTHIPKQGLHIVENNKISSLPFTHYFADKTVSGIISINQHELLITTARHGIFVTDKTQIKPWNTALNTLFPETFINCALLLSNGNIALGTQHSGVYVINQAGEILLHLDKKRGLLSHTILSLYEDENQNLWVGLNNGISFVELKSPFRQINEEVGLPGTGYAALQTNGKLYLGTNNGLYISKGNNPPQLIEGSEGQVYNIQLINKDLLIGHNNGAFVLKSSNSHSFLKSNKKSKQQIIAQSIDNSIGTWVFLELEDVVLQGTYEGIKILDATNYAETGRISNLNESSRILVKENDSTVWMSHGYKGIYRIQLINGSPYATKIEYYNKDHLLPSNFFNTAHLIEGQLKVSTEMGIYNYDVKDNKFLLDKNLSKHFAEEQISVIKSDIYGNVYFITNKAVGFLEKLKNNEYKKHIGSFNPIRKLLNDDLSNISFISPNQVLLGAKDGFVVFDRNLFWTTEKEVFNTIIRQVSYKGKETALLYGGNMSQKNQVAVSNRDNYPELTYSNNTLLFSFSSTSFSATLAPEFQYKLAGFDRDWQDWTESNFKEYTNLKEGFYTFQVKSRNANNIESDTESYSFIIIYPWYRSPVAYIIYVLIGISILISIVLSLDKRHQLEKKKLEQKRVKELSEKEKQLHSITRKSEDEINQLRNEKLESEIMHINTELASNTMHILNKNEFINSIKSTLGGVIKKSTNQEVQSQISRIIKNIEKNIATDGDWQNFQIHFDKVHGDFSKRIKQEFPLLSPQEIKLSAYLRLNLSTKEIANLLSISVRGVEIGRYRLRKKLQLERTQNLAEFILNY